MERLKSALGLLDLVHYEYMQTELLSASGRSALAYAMDECELSM